MKAKKIKLGFIAMALTFIPVLDFSDVSKVMVKSDELSDVRLWTTYNTYTVLQDPATMEADHVIPPEVLSEGEDLTLNVKMGRGENEGAQLIMTPGKSVKSYNVEVSDLTNGENIIPKENIDVFNQYYSYIPLAFDNVEYIPTGMTPDYLIPMEWAVEAGENKIKAGNNQGVTIDVATEVDTVPGEYTGTVTLTLDGKVREIPLNVTVKDVDLSQTTMPITLASFGEIQDRSVYEKLMNYRVMGQYMYHGNYSPDAMVEELRRYYNEPRFGSYEIPNVNTEVFEGFMRAIAIACDTDQVNYFTKAMTYIQVIDESRDVNYIINTVKTYVAKKNNIIAQLISLMPNSSVEFRQSVADAISEFPLYNAMYQLDWGSANPGDAGLTLCYNYYDHAHTEEIEQFYFEKSATQPLVYSNNYFPAVANSLPNYGQANRYMGWSQQKYDFGGMLLWAGNEITTEITANRGTTEQYQVHNYYDNQNSWSTVYGAANYIIPAKKYGKPLDWVVNLRILAMRDGVEDHALLTKLEESYETLANRYGISDFDFDDALDLIYKRAFYTGYTYHIDSGKTLFEMRDMIYDLLEMANGDSKLMITDSNLESNRATIEFYSIADRVKINGVTQTGTEGKYSYTLNLNDTTKLKIETTKLGEKETFEGRMFSYSEIQKVDDKVALTNENVSQYIESSPAGGKGYIPKGTVDYDVANKVIKIDIPTCEGTALQTIGYSPKFTLHSALFGVKDLYDVTYVSMKIRVKYKTGDPDAQVPLSININQSTSNSMPLWTVLFNEKTYVGDGWHERYVTFRIDKYNLATVKQLTFTFSRESYVWSKVYNMGAEVEISDINYSMCEYPNLTGV